MPWCPKCKNEYVEGIKICADCGVELMDELPKEEVFLYSGEENLIQTLNDFLIYNNLSSTHILVNKESGEHEVWVLEAEYRKAATVTDTFLQNHDELKEREDVEESYIVSSPKEISEEIEVEKILPVKGAYYKSSQRAEDNRSSAYTLLIVGIIGLLSIILMALGILPFFNNSSTKFLIYGVMGFLFFAFIVMGIVSYQKAKELSKKASFEESITKEMTNWCHSNLSAESIDANFSVQERMLSEEMKYFKRSEQIKKEISSQYMNLDEDFLDNFIEDIYAEIYES